MIKLQGSLQNPASPQYQAIVVNLDPNTHDSNSSDSETDSSSIKVQGRPDTNNISPTNIGQQFLTTDKAFDYYEHQDLVCNIENALVNYEHQVFDDELTLLKLTRTYDINQAYHKIKQAHVTRNEQSQVVHEAVSRIGYVIMDYFASDDDKISFMKAFGLNIFLYYGKQRLANLIFQVHNIRDFSLPYFPGICKFTFGVKNKLLEYMKDTDYHSLVTIETDNINIKDIMFFTKPRNHKYLDNFFALKIKFASYDLHEQYCNIVRLIMDIPEQYRKRMLHLLGIRDLSDIIFAKSHLGIYCGSTAKIYNNEVDEDDNNNNIMLTCLLPYVSVKAFDLVNTMIPHEHRPPASRDSINPCAEIQMPVSIFNVNITNNYLNNNVSDDDGRPRATNTFNRTYARNRCTLCSKYSKEIYESIPDYEYFWAIKILVSKNAFIAQEGIERFKKLDNTVKIPFSHPELYNAEDIKDIMNYADSTFDNCTHEQLVDYFYNQTDLKLLGNRVSSIPQPISLDFITRWTQHHKYDINNMPSDRVAAKIWLQAYPDKIGQKLDKLFDISKLSADQQRQVLFMFI